MQSSSTDKKNSNLPPVSKGNIVTSIFKTILIITLLPLQFIIIWFKGDDNQNSYTRHSVFITKLKISLISLSIVMLIGLIIWPLTDTAQKGHKISIDSSEINSSEDSIRMIKPRFYGINNDNQPYNIIATEAKQQSNDIVLLNNVTGDMFLKDGTKISMKSDFATYNLIHKQIKLTENVYITSDNGYNIKTEIVNADMLNHLIKGEKKVRITGLLGILDANSFIIKNNMNEIKFYGDVHVIAYPTSQNSSRKILGENR